VRRPLVIELHSVTLLHSFSVLIITPFTGSVVVQRPACFYLDDFREMQLCMSTNKYAIIVLKI
jgi:hypothetical protein